MPSKFKKEKSDLEIRVQKLVSKCTRIQGIYLPHAFFELITDRWSLANCYGLDFVCLPHPLPSTQNIYILNPHSWCLRMWLHLEFGSLKRYVCAKSFQPCLTLWDPMDCSLPGFSVHGILQARILEWIATPSSRGSSQPRDWTCVSYISFIGRWVIYH